MSSSDDQDFVMLDADDSLEDDEGLLPDQSAENIPRVQQWLNPTDYSADSSDYRKHLTSYVPETGEWIQQSEEYQQWLFSPDHGVLWIKAVAGAGKSVVAANIISRLAKDDNVPVLYFFFRQIIASNKTPRSLIRDFLSQALPYNPRLRSTLQQYLEKGRDLDSISHGELWNLLVASISTMPRCYCVVDAIDEMDMGNESFMRNLIELGQVNPATLKILITSRPLPYIEKIFNDERVLPISLRPSHVDIDITIYIENRLASVNLHDTAANAIQSALQTKSAGNFLYARLMLDDILQPGRYDLDHIDDVLNRLPSGLGVMYSQMLHDHSVRSGTAQNLQLLILQSVTHSARPLRLLELAALVDFAAISSKIDLNIQKTKFARNTKAIIRTGCGPLLEILEDETVSIIHHSLTEFLFDPDRFQFTSDATPFPCVNSFETHRAIGTACIQYLLSGWHDEWDGNAQFALAALLMNHPFLDYAAHYWHYHLLKSGDLDESLYPILDRLMDPKSEVFEKLIQLMGNYKQPLPFHFAASIGLTNYVIHLVECGLDINGLDEEEGTPLHCAAKNGHTQVVALLLENGASNNKDDKFGLTPLHEASSRNHFAIVKLLLKSGVDPFTPKTKDYPGNWCGNCPTSEGETPVEYAAKYGHIECVREFLPYLDIEGLSQAIHWAALGGKSEIIRLIVEQPDIDVNLMFDGKTPVYVASHSHDLSSMRLLLDRGASVTQKSDNYFHKDPTQGGYNHPLEYTPLHGFIQSSPDNNGRERSKDPVAGIKMLLEAGCDVNAYDTAGMTPFQECLNHCSRWDAKYTPEIVNLMLEYGADITLSSKSYHHPGQTPLHLVGRGSIQILELLIAKGADVNARCSNKGQTPIFTFIDDYTSDENLLALIKHGADCNVRDNVGNSPLHEMFKKKPAVSKLKVLLDNGADINCKNDEGKTPFHMMDSWFLGDAMPLILLAKPDLEMTTNEGLTVLLQAIKNEASIDYIRGLVNGGSKLDARDLDGRTALHLACELSDSAKIVTFLVQSSADPKAVDFSGNTLFHEIAKSSTGSIYEEKHMKLLEAIFKVGAVPNALNHLGQSPLHIVSGLKEIHQPSLEFLLGPKCNIDVNAVDHEGVRPIHLAAIISERRVRYLLKHNADPFVLNLARQSPLHMAARAGQSNVVGFLVDLYTERKRSELIDEADQEGRSALHYACRVGRLESVEILLNAGADPNLTDARGSSPLHMCAQFRKDESRWIDLYPQEHTTGIRYIIRLLTARGADLSFMHNLQKGRSGVRNSPFQDAVLADSEVMVDELLQISDKLESKDEKDDKSGEAGRWYLNTEYSDFMEKYIASRSQDAPSLLEGIVKPGENNIAIFGQLLRLENERGLEELRNLGADFIKPEWAGESCLKLLVSGGHASLLEKFGSQAADMNESWVDELEKETKVYPGSICPLLITACERELPNLSVIKVLVEKLGVDINWRSRRDDNCALHDLVRSDNWWSISALEYLLKKGANTEFKCNESYQGYTPLHSAIEYYRYRKDPTCIRLLLQYGADPNALDKNQESCLAKLGADMDIAQLLLAHEANPAAGIKPYIFTAIQEMNLSMVEYLAELKTNFNVRPPPDNVSGGDIDDYARRYAIRHSEWNDGFEETSFPIHYAARRRFNTPEHKTKMIPIIECLLKVGANPLLPFNEDGDIVLHDILEQKGIVEPFLTLPGLDLEIRDAKGRTLLLAACSTSKDVSKFDAREDAHVSPTNAEILIGMGANINAVDKAGKNVLHHLVERGASWQSKETLKDIEMVLTHPSGTALLTQNDHAGFTTLQDALGNSELWIVEKLLKVGADPLDLDPDNNTALHYLAAEFDASITYGQDYKSFDEYWGSRWTPDLFKQFLELGVDINAANKLGETAIFRLVASKGVCIRHLKTFVDAGADVKVVNKKGRGLLHVLAMNKDVKELCDADAGLDEKGGIVGIFQWFVARGLDPLAEDGEQRSSLDLAAGNGQEKILEMFKRER